MNFIANESAQKLRGGFYTDRDIADFLATWALEGRPRSILEPSCGDGAFLESLAGRGDGDKRTIVGWELDPAEAAKAVDRTRNSGAQVDIRNGDFLKWFLFEGAGAPVFDAVVGNPPFIRYQYLNPQQQEMAERIFARARLPFTRHTNAWVPFVLASLALLAPGGRLGMVIPSEILHIRHAQPLRDYLVGQCSRIIILDPEELWFQEALQGIVLLLAEKKTDPAAAGSGVSVQSVPHRRSLESGVARFRSAAQFIPPEELDGKWMPALLSAPERALVRALTVDGRFARFQQLAEVDVGIVTGANDFFVVSDEVVKAFELEPWAHPMFGRSEHVAGLIYRPDDHARNRQAGLPANFLWFDAAEMSAFPAVVQKYLQAGVEQQLPGRYKCRVRDPWFRVPSVYKTEVAMLKRAHHCPRLILNASGAYTTDTAYRIKANGTDAVTLVYSFFNSLTCLTAELEGRHYGGGVLELVPSEIERLLVPLRSASERELQEVDRQFRASTDVGQLLRSQDRIILRAAGLTLADTAVVHQAWERLRRRRQRHSSANGMAE